MMALVIVLHVAPCIRYAAAVAFLIIDDTHRPRWPHTALTTVLQAFGPRNHMGNPIRPAASYWPQSIVAIGIVTPVSGNT